MLLLGGVAFRIEPEDVLHPAELGVLQKLGRVAAVSPGAEATGAPFVVRIVPDPPWGHEPPPPAAPAAVSWEHGRVRLRQASFLAELDPQASTALLHRRTREGFALEVTLRTALSCRLPLNGGLPLHAAGLVLGDRAVVFHGPSGAGKSTIAAASPGPVLSDELVAVVPGTEWRAVATGFFGTQEATLAVGAAPLAALIELDQGPYRLERVDARRALTRLALATLVPLAPPLWSAALGAIGHLAREVPCYRMAWSLEDPPFARLADALRL